MMQKKSNPNQPAYQLGYAAGRRRAALDLNLERSAMRKEFERNFKDEVFFSVLTFCLNAQGWTFGDKKISSTDDRVKLAWCIAKSAIDQRG
jgi:hypothetical protein